MINTYLIDNAVWEKTGSIDILKDMREAFVEMGSTAAELYAENQALKGVWNYSVRLRKTRIKLSLGRLRRKRYLCGDEKIK